MNKRDVLELKKRLNKVSQKLPELMKKYASFGIEIRHGYGVTECSGGIMSNSSKKRYASVGKSGVDWSIKIRHEKGEKSGEILIKGPGVMLGYYKNKKDTKKVLKNGIMMLTIIYQYIWRDITYVK